MCLSAFRAKNEVAEFVFGDALFVIGGVLLGFDGAGFWWKVIGMGCVFGGLFLGMRVLESFSADLSEARGKIDNALSNLRDADLAARQASQVLEKQRNDVEALTRKMNEAEQKLEATKADMKRQADDAHKAFERIFGHSSAFSNFSWSNTLARRVEDHETRHGRLEKNGERQRRGQRLF